MVGAKTSSPAALAGQLLWIGFDGTRWTPRLAALLRDVAPGGVVLFGRNLTSDPRQVRALTDAIHRALPVPPFIALDQEGGRVSRLRPLVGPTPACGMLAARSDATLAVRRHAEATALALRCLGFNVNFAPVLDLSGADAANGIGDRAFGEDPRTVALLAGLYIAAHQRGGVIPVGKHFPGLGGAGGDTHEMLPSVRRTREQLLRQDLLPYRRLRAALPIVMIGHACYPALQGRTSQPASLSHAVVTTILRRRLGYCGLVLTDDLEMGAVDQSLDGGAQAIAAFGAGADGLMFCRSEERIRQAAAALRRVIASGDLPAARWRGSLRRIQAVKRRCLHSRRRARYSAGALARARAVFASLTPAAAAPAGADPTARD
jgi:beta-N-acetylhexosaminidase